MKISLRKIRYFVANVTLFLILQSCETLSEIPGKVLETGSDAIDYVGSVFENETQNNEIKGNNNDSKVNAEDIVAESKKEINATADSSIQENEFLENSDQVLEAVPPENLDINSINKIEEEVVNNKEAPFRDEEVLSNRERSSSSVNFKQEVEENISFDNNFKLESNLILKNKVQFKIATINFMSGSSLISSKDIKKIRKVIKIALDKSAQVRIVGHASTRTKDMSQLEHKLANFDISDRRSQAVAQIFVENKFPASKLITEAVSDSKPLFHESMPAGTFGNQRTEIFIIY